MSSRITCGEYVEAALYLQAAFQLQPEAFAEETAAGDSVRQLFSTLCCGEGETKLRRIPYRGPREEDGHLLGQIGEILHAAQNKFFRQVEVRGLTCFRRCVVPCRVLGGAKLLCSRGCRP